MTIILSELVHLYRLQSAVDGEFQFLQLDTKLQKLASKLWKSKNFLNNDKPQLTFYLRVMHYVNNIGLLRWPTHAFIPTNAFKLNLLMLALIYLLNLVAPA